jgi:hypothetical protein
MCVVVNQSIVWMHNYAIVLFSLLILLSGNVETNPGSRPTNLDAKS